ncbi:hypothetical protein BCR43DRAFT_442549 [Syncephalastrum racemosum]|uniref:ERCC4 domain-containing protein n=1 Tax=Syncephalastrum racemosum TaxID=13706 RepID=A0A1X2H8G6_SYNRA|nr:hypothetical protein BCR43DRAFT_442549 [Syncephalastrum racemosum]
MSQPLLDFQKQILQDIVEEDALLILSQGLGLFKILCSFIQLHCTDKHLVLVLNTTPAQDAAINDHLISQGFDPQNLMQLIDYDTPAEQRSNMYRQSGVFSVTSRILAVDMLLQRVPTAMISGIIVYNAHRVKQHSMEELILQIYREENENGFIKALSDQPEAFTTGFAPLQNTLKSLRLRTTFLWPRFQILVSDNLANAAGDVVELRQPMTENMDKIQQALVECMEATLGEIKRQNSQVDVEEFTIENSFFKSFDLIVRRQLDPIWHRVTSSTKQLVGDLTILRQLLGYLTSYDCISFYSFLETVMATNTSRDGKQVRQSQWLFLDAADTAINTARKRFYFRKTDPEYKHEVEKEGQNKPDILLNMEEQPKWRLLREILAEIELDMQHTTAIFISCVGAPVLIMTNDKRTCSQLKHYMSQMSESDPGASTHTRPVLGHLAERYFTWKRSMQKIQLASAQEAATMQSSNASSSTSSTMTPPGSISMRGTQPLNKRRRVRGGSVAAAASPSGRMCLRTYACEWLETTTVNLVLNFLLRLDAETEGQQDKPMEGVGPQIDTLVVESNDILPSFDLVPAERLVMIQQYDGDLDEQRLEDFQPRFIIMYDPDPAFVRRVEVYRALHPELHVRVYFMLYDNSVEEQNYLSLIRKEKEAFERLIREKSIMAIPLDQQKGKKQESAFTRALNSRVAGGQLKSTEQPQVIVDMREFRSSLPVLLYAQGLKVIPCTLEIGDYILSPDICIERKSISDLIASFRSGRLYTQCENMSMHYKTPILLIEFDQNKSFSLQSLTNMKENIGINDLSSKLVLLTLTFPKVRVMWSSSPHETAAVFEELKKLEPEPEADKAALVGVEEPEDTDATQNMTPQEILRSMPGVTSKNYRILMSAAETLEELFRMSREQLKELIGEEPSKHLYDFIHKKQASIS